jgi:hypothetical protein
MSAVFRDPRSDWSEERPTGVTRPPSQSWAVAGSAIVGAESRRPEAPEREAHRKRCGGPVYAAPFRGTYRRGPRKEANYPTAAVGRMDPAAICSLSQL